jgi:putative membrane protein
MGTGGGLLMVLGTLLLIAAIAVILIVVARSAGDQRARQELTPEQILAARYARGEISEDELGHRRDVLKL